ncbi:MAG: hypothetical protein KKD44_21465 [Proteobacteria bacterium]|nr:hypothetical protein [Pseudomonadota bacterium]
MDNLFEEMFTIEGIMGALVISDDGSSEFTKFSSPLSERIGDKDFGVFIKNSINIEALKGAFDSSMETLLIYEKIRLYIRKIKSGYLLIAMGMFVPVAMVRMNCQIIIPELDNFKKKKGLGRFFKNK